MIVVIHRRKSGAREPIGICRRDVIWLVAGIAIGLAVLATWMLIRHRPAGRTANVAIGALATGVIAVAVLGPAGWAASAVTSIAPHNDLARAAFRAAARLCHGEDSSEGWQIDWDDAQIWDYLATWPSGPARTASPNSE